MEKPGCFEASALMYIAGKKITYMDKLWLEKANKWQQHHGFPSGYNKEGGWGYGKHKSTDLFENRKLLFPSLPPTKPTPFSQLLSQRNTGPFGMGCLEFQVKVPDFNSCD